MLSNTQLNYLKAVCNKVKQYSSAETLQQYKLGTSANVRHIRSALEAKDVIDTVGPEVEIFEHWLKTVFLQTP